MIQLIVITSIVLIILAGFIVLFMFFYQTRVERHRREMQRLQEEFEQELLKTQIELQEQVLGEISSEIHDNMGQMLTVIKINLNHLARLKSVDDTARQLADETKEQVIGVIEDMRSLSKTLSQDYIADFGIAQAITLEMERIRHTGVINTSVDIRGDNLPISPKAELMLFRISQELVNNALKHADAKNLDILLDYNDESLKMVVADDGVGFDTLEVGERDGRDTGRGLKNMQNRVKIIGGVLTLETSKGRGTKVEITINTRNGLLNKL